METGVFYGIKLRKRASHI